MHVLLDAGQIRLRQDFPKEVVQMASGGTPIDGSALNWYYPIDLLLG